MADSDYRPLADMRFLPDANPLGLNALRGLSKIFMAPGQAYQSTTPISSEEMIKPAFDLAGTTTLGAGAFPAEANTLRSGAKIVPLAIKDAVAAAEPEVGMTRLYRGGSQMQGKGPKFVTTSRKYAEGYTTPGLAYHPQIGSYLQYADVPSSRIQIPLGQKVHSFEAPEDIVSQLQPFYRPR